MGSGASTQIKAIGDETDRTKNSSNGTLHKSVSLHNASDQTRTRKRSPAETLSLKSTSSSSPAVKLQPLGRISSGAKPKIPASPSTSTASSTPVMSPPSSSKSKSRPPPHPAHADLEAKLAQLEKELAESESQKLDHLDHIQALEDRVQELTAAAMAPRGEGDGGGGGGDFVAGSGALHETLKAKDHYIQQMETQLAAVQADFSKVAKDHYIQQMEQQLAAVQADFSEVRVRLKRRIKNLNAQLTEARQESSIAQLEMKDRNSQLQDELRSSKGDRHVGGAPRDADQEEESSKESKLSVILDLSAQVSDQAQKIAALERLVEEREREIQQLHSDPGLSQSRDSPRGPDRDRGGGGNRLKTQPQNGSSHHGLNPHGGRHVSFSGVRPRGGVGVTPVESSGGGGGSQSSSTSNSRAYQGPRPHSKIGPRPRQMGAASAADHVLSHLTLTRESTALSDSDSDWEMDMTSPKVRSAPARVRVKSAQENNSNNNKNYNHNNNNSNADTLEDNRSLMTDDNDLTFAGEARASSHRSRHNRKSALKTRLERERNERAKCLMGPSLAFGAAAGDQLSDSSTNSTPRHPATPRSAVRVPPQGCAATDVMKFTF